MVNIGFGNLVNERHVISVVVAGSNPTKRMISAARDNNLLVDTTMGRKTRSVIVMNDGHIVISSVSHEALADRFRDAGINV